MRTLEEKKAEELKSREPMVTIDPSLNKYRDVVLFPEKLERANEILRKTGHPENYLKKK